MSFEIEYDILASKKVDDVFQLFSLLFLPKPCPVFFYSNLFTSSLPPQYLAFLLLPCPPIHKLIAHPLSCRTFC